MEKLPANCHKCGQDFLITRGNKQAHQRTGIAPSCEDCQRKADTERIKQAMDGLTVEEKQECRKRAVEKIKAKGSQSVYKQWATIRSDPKNLEVVINKRREEMKKVWDNMPTEEKNRRVKAWFGSHGCRRSKGNELLKQKMQEANLYDGFVSEQAFCGYIPDEINHELKMIIEFYGDVYHCNPSQYKDENRFVNLIKRTVGEQWRRDRKRLGVFYQQGYSVLIVWSRDFHNREKAELERIQDEIARKKVLVGVL
jgi:very-short-patch-repair endonuclease